MDFQWITFALLLVFLILGAVRAIWGSFLKNLLELACIPLAFLLAWIIQLVGGFQAIAELIVSPIMKNMIQGELSHDTSVFITASAASLIATVFFILVFVLLLVVLQTVAVKVILPRIKKDENETEKLGKKAISCLAGALGGFLVLGVILMPVFYIMDIADSASPIVRELECDDSQVYRAFDVIDKELVSPYEKGVATLAYKYTGISYVMSSTASLGGKMVAESGEKEYAADSLKTVISSGADILITLQSKNANGEHLNDDVKGLFSDPIISNVVTDLAIMGIDKMEVDQEKAHTDLLAALSLTLKEHYANIERKQVANDIHAFGDAIVCLNDYDHLIPLLANKNAVSGLDEIITDQECLEETVHILTAASAYDDLLETVYEFEVESICKMLEIPYDDNEAYTFLIEHLLDALNAVEADSISINDAGYFAKKFADSGRPLDTIYELDGPSFDKDLYQNWNKYQKAWRTVQDAFSAACEDTSLGAIWLEYEGKMYFYDGTTYVWTESDRIADRYSPISPLCQYLVSLAVDRDGEITESVLVSWLKAYESSSEESVALARKIANKESFKSSAVTYEKMLGAADFSTWDEESRQNDSKLIIQIIIKLKTVAEGISNTSTEDENYVRSITDQLGTLGESLDLMYETSCVKDLPLQLTQGMLQNDTFRKYINAGVVRELNEAVKNHEQMTYTSFMYSIKGIISLVIDKIEDFGGAIQ